MTWRERFGRAARPVVQSIARAVRGDSAVQNSPSTSAQHAEADVFAVPSWGLLPSLVPARVEMLRGASSAEILRGAWGATFRVSAVAAMVATVSILKLDGIPLFWVVPFAVLSGGGFRAVRSHRAAARMRGEHRAGYTVWNRKNVQYPQVDDRTGYVIREAGAPKLSKQQQADAVKRVRYIRRFAARHLRTTHDPG